MNRCRPLFLLLSLLALPAGSLVAQQFTPQTADGQIERSRFATIHTAGVTVGITGTTLMVEYNPKN